MTLELDGRIVKITNPDRVVFPRTGHTKLDLISYYRVVAEGAMRGVADRPVILKRFMHASTRRRSSRSARPPSAPSGWRSSS